MIRTLTLIITIALIAASCGNKEEQTKKAIRPVNYITITESTISNSFTFSGTTQSHKEVNLSFKVSGIINKRHVKIGDKVSKGQTLAEISPEDFLVELRQAEANKKSMEVQLVNARSNYYRVEKLFENNSLSLSDFQSAKASFESAEAQLAAADQKVIAAQNQVSYTKLKAPFSGIITNIAMEEDELASAGSTIATISAIGQIEILVGIPESFIYKLKKGMLTQVNLSPLPGKIFKGEIFEVGYSTIGGSTYPLTIRMLDEDEAIRPGMPAYVKFKLDNTDISNNIIVPATAVGEDNKGRFVLILTPESDNTASVSKGYVNIGRLTPDGFEIKSGLKIGQKISTAGLNTLLEGDIVKL
ncbi:efflux RND transporter periplasmic adaptor subunit [Puteibacter caeruleilacunae]|nr:efflux RND transporter periplasmic adaptor subunit [Puteibacter caeruleilacunae]